MVLLGGGAVFMSEVPLPSEQARLRSMGTRAMRWFDDWQECEASSESRPASEDTTPCGMTGVTIHYDRSDFTLLCKVTPVIPHGAVSPDCISLYGITTSTSLAF